MVYMYMYNVHKILLLNNKSINRLKTITNGDDYILLYGKIYSNMLWIINLILLKNCLFIFIQLTLHINNNILYILELL